MTRYPTEADNGLSGCFVRSWVTGLHGGYRWLLHCPSCPVLHRLVMGETKADAFLNLKFLNDKRSEHGLPQVYAAKFFGCAWDWCN